MTPAARHQTAIDILDTVLAGVPAEQALTRWARASRYAGSKDRAAVRDIVFDILRKRTSAAARSGSLTGRGLVIGLLMLNGENPDAVFSGVKYGPKPLDENEKRALLEGTASEDCYDVPEWIVPEFEAGLGADTGRVLASLREQAPVFLRVNSRKSARDAAQSVLAEDGIVTETVDGVDLALRVTVGARKVAGSRAFRDGLVEVQDASSQAAVRFMPLPRTGRILDYCAGGGGKALAMAALSEAGIYAHDSDPARMKDIPSRAARAGCSIGLLDSGDMNRQGKFDLVLCDAPCSGTGAWRRSPDARWRFGADDLRRLLSVQQEILNEAVKLVHPGGHLVYATCSLLECENNRQLSGWLADGGDGWRILDQMTRLPDARGDGFFCAVLSRADYLKQP